MTLLNDFWRTVLMMHFRCCLIAKLQMWGRRVDLAMKQQTRTTNYLTKMWQNVKMISHWTWSFLPKITQVIKPFSRRLLGQLHIRQEVYHSFCHPVESRFKALPLWLQYSIFLSRVIALCFYSNITQHANSWRELCKEKQAISHTEAPKKKLVARQNSLSSLTQSFTSCCSFSS